MLESYWKFTLGNFFYQESSLGETRHIERNPVTEASANKIKNNYIREGENKQSNNWNGLYREREGTLCLREQSVGRKESGSNYYRRWQ